MGEITRGWLGVQIRPMTAEVAQVLGLDAPKGAVIEAIGDDSPAKKAGLEKGDIILSFNDTEGGEGEQQRGTPNDRKDRSEEKRKQGHQRKTEHEQEKKGKQKKQE